MSEENRTSEAFEIVKRALQADPAYAWSWHCNLAMAAVDEGVDYDVANKMANRFMQLCWGVDTKSPTDVQTV